MGVAGWNELQDNVSLVGIATGDTYSGHDNVFNPFGDWDWSLFVQPGPGFEHLATNSKGIQNDNGVIECEIQPPDGFWDDQIMHHYLDPLIGHTVTVVGTWVEDISHNLKTEIHPITSILDETRNGGGLLDDTEKILSFFVFCDTSTQQAVWREHLPPHANEHRVGQFRVQFPPPPQPGLPPLFSIWEENDHSLAKNIRITAQGNDAFLEGTIEVNQAHAFYFGRIYMGYRAVKWSDEEDLGGVLASAPAACTWGPGRVDTFYQGQNQHLWHRWFDGAWQPEEDLGGVLASDPAACTWGPGRVDTFYRGQNGHLWHRWFDGGWQPEEDLAGTLTSAPAACTWGPGRVDIFYRGQNNHLWHRWFDGGWHAEEDLGGVLTSAPATCTWGPGRVDIFYRGQNSHLWHRWFDGGWQPEEDLGGVLTSAPAACAWGPGHVDIFYRGQNNHLWHRGFDGGWHAEEDLEGVLASAPAVCTWGPNRIDTFYQGQNQHLWHRWFPA